MSRTNPVYTENVAHYVSAFDALVGERTDEPAWLEALRREAIDAFATLGFPSPRLEDWRYTNVAPIARLAFERATTGKEGPQGGLALPVPDVAPSVFWNGRGVDGSPDEIPPFELQKDRALALLNTAFFEEAVVLTVSRDTALDAPIHLLLVSSGSTTINHPRIVIDAEPGSRATIVVEHVSADGSGPVFTNAVTQVTVGVNAALDLVVLQRENDASYHVSNTACRIERDGRFTSHTLSLGGALVRNDLDVLLADEGAECNLRGLFLGSGDRVVDNHTFVDHAMPHGTSRELYKGLLGGHSRGVFRGRIVVRPDAQKTDATQSNRNLLLARGAEIDTKPQLEIYADDVKCAHGSTIGQLDEDALFYLRSRGIGERDAQELLVGAFANEITNAIPGEALAAAVRERVRGPLADALGSEDR